MSDTVIEVENLSKKYIIGHQKQERYTALRDVIADGAKAFWRSLFGGGSGSPENKEEFWALKDVSFEVKQGECIGIIGRNGAGKSTLLKILSRITEPTTGRIKIRGRVASLLEVGTGFHPELTGRENIFLNGSILGMSRAEIRAKFDEIVDFAEVEKFLDTPVKFYSSGMYVRLAFAVAAHLEPEILIVDEVLAVGDAAFQKKCLGKMGDVAEKEGRTVLFVSHNMNALVSLCNSAILIDRGNINYQGTVTKAIEKYFVGIKNENNCLDISEYRIDKSLENKLIYFTKIKLTKDDKQFLFKENINIETSFFSIIKTNNLSIGGGIYNGMGNAIGTFITEGFSIEKNESKNLVFSVINLHLSPGIYSMSFSITKGDLSNTHIDNYDIVVGILQFEVLPFNDQEKIAMWNPAWGNIVLNNYVIKKDNIFQRNEPEKINLQLTE